MLTTPITHVRWVVQHTGCVASRVALTLCGCSGKASPPAANTAAGTQTTITTTSAPERITRAGLPVGYELYWNFSTVYSGCTPYLSKDKTDTSGEVFDTATGRNIPLPKPPVAAGDELVASACTVTATRDGAQRVIYLVTTKTPSHGLTPEVKRTTVAAFDASKPEPIATQPFPLPTDDSSDWYLYPSEGGFVAVDGAADVKQLVFFDAGSLQPQQPVAEGPNKPIQGLNADGYVTTMCNTSPLGGCSTTDAHFVSGRDSAEVGVFRNVGAIVPANHGFLLNHYSKGTPADSSELATGVFFFDMRTKSVLGPIAPYLTFQDSTFPSGVDPEVYGDTILLAGTDSSLGSYLKVFDMAAGKEVFSLDDKQLAGLNVGQAFVGDHFVYLQKTSDNPVIDYRTMQVVSQTWSLRPLYKLAGGWVVIKPGGPSVSAQTVCFGTYYGSNCQRGNSTETGGEFIARGPTRDYEGPWF